MKQPSVDESGQAVILLALIAFLCTVLGFVIGATVVAHTACN